MAVHVDEPGAVGAVAAAAAAVPAADAEDAEAEAVVATLDDHDLLWYDPHRAAGPPRIAPVMSRSWPETAKVRERLDGVALALPGVQAQDAYGHRSYLLKGKRIAWQLVDHHGDDRLALWVKAPPGSSGHWWTPTLRAISCRRTSVRAAGSASWSTTAAGPTGTRSASWSSRPGG